MVGKIDLLLKGKSVIDRAEIEAALDFALGQVVDNLGEFTASFKRAFSTNNFYDATENVNWTTGFWTGQVWLAWEWAKRKGLEREAGTLKRAGEIQIDSFLDRINGKREVDHHDMGFLYSPSCVAGYKLIGSEKGREAAVKAADQLISRFHPVGEFIQAWGPMDQPENYRFIIDCLLNLPLLYWATEETGDGKYREIAQKHIHTAIANVIREDYSTYFFYEHGDRGAGPWGYVSGVSGRVRLGQRPGMGGVRDGFGIPVYEEGGVY